MAKERWIKCLLEAKHCRTTKGKVYKLDHSGDIKADDGKKLTPSLWNDQYWMDVDEPVPEVLLPPKATPTPKKYVRRLYECHSPILKRITQFKTYELHKCSHSYYVIGDNGEKFFPAYPSPSLWEDVDGPEVKSEIDPTGDALANVTEEHNPEPVKYLKRLTALGTLFTVGKVYKLVDATHVLTDGGSRWYLLADEEGAWEEVQATKSVHELLGGAVQINGQPAIAAYHDEAVSTVSREESSKTTKLNEKETIMLTIKKATLVNGRDADEMSVDQIISYIREEGLKINAIVELKVDSTAISKIKKSHQDNIKALTDILDAREV